MRATVNSPLQIATGLIVSKTATLKNNADSLPHSSTRVAVTSIGILFFGIFEMNVSSTSPISEVQTTSIFELQLSRRFNSGNVNVPEHCHGSTKDCTSLMVLIGIC